MGTPPPFLWIHRDADYLSSPRTRDLIESIKVQQHVQRGLRRKKRQNELTTLGACSSRSSFQSAEQSNSANDTDNIKEAPVEKHFTAQMDEFSVLDLSDSDECSQESQKATCPVPPTSDQRQGKCTPDLHLDQPKSGLNCFNNEQLLWSFAGQSLFLKEGDQTMITHQDMSPSTSTAINTYTSLQLNTSSSSGSYPLPPGTWNGEIKIEPQQAKPFFRSPSLVPEVEDVSLRLYLTLLPPVVIGTRPGALYCPLRLPALKGLQSTDLVRQWIGVIAQQYVMRRQELTASRRMFALRAQCYKALNRYLQAPLENFHQAFFGIYFAQLADHTLEPPGSSEVHITALDSLLQIRGGTLGFLEEDVIEPFYLVVQYLFGKRLPLNPMEFEPIKSRWLKVMSRLENWITNTRVSYARQLFADDEDFDAAANEHFKSRTLALLSRVLDVPGSSYIAAASRFLLLYDYLLTVMELGERTQATFIFFERLTEIANQSLAFDAVDLSPLQSVALSSMVSHVRDQIYERHPPREADVRKVEIATAEIDALKIFASMSDLGRSHLMSQLRSWTFCADGSSQFCIE